MTTENVQKQTDDFLAKALKSYENLLPQMKEGEAKELAKDGFVIVKTEIERRAQKKSDPQPTAKTEQLDQPEMRPPTKEELEAWQKGMESEAKKGKEKFESTMRNAGMLGSDKPSEAFQKSIDRIASGLNQAPQVAPKPTATIHFAGQQYPGQYTRGELWSDVRQNFKLVLLSATFRRCLNSGDYSELWSMVLFVKLYQGIHEGLKNLEGGKDYTMEELLIRHWTYGEDTKEAGRALAEYLKQPKPEQPKPQQ